MVVSAIHHCCFYSAYTAVRAVVHWRPTRDAVGLWEAFVFLVFTCKTATTRQSKTVLNSHQKSGCVCSLVTFSLLFVCLFVCLCQFVSELRFDGFSLRRPLPLHSSFLQAAAAAAPSSTDQGRLSEVSPD